MLFSLNSLLFGGEVLMETTHASTGSGAAASKGKTIHASNTTAVRKGLNSSGDFMDSAIFLVHLVLFA